MYHTAHIVNHLEDSDSDKDIIFNQVLIELKVLINFVRCRKQTGKKTNLDRVRFCFNGLVCWCGLHEGKGPSDFSVLWEWSFFFGNIYNFMIFNVYTLFFQTSKKHLGGESILFQKKFERPIYILRITVCPCKFIRQRSSLAKLTYYPAIYTPMWFYVLYVMCYVCFIVKWLYSHVLYCISNGFAVVQIISFSCHENHRISSNKTDSGFLRDLTTVP